MAFTPVIEESVGMDSPHHQHGEVLLSLLARHKSLEVYYKPSCINIANPRKEQALTKLFQPQQRKNNIENNGRTTILL
ncbi:hypothetical protein OUZ56_017509 [Daphnia magna]|uniref:Uncharacterized protein n=1 Tax=Daphnia magna TaxID=35525 RepID=A0ABR0ASZ6_9CRUS|nr:hypothetical protein OUZ56_017509 [Daphnia magna]